MLRSQGAIHKSHLKINKYNEYNVHDIHVMKNHFTSLFKVIDTYMWFLYSLKQECSKFQDHENPVP